jgi:hypothetical protein
MKGIVTDSGGDSEGSRECGSIAISGDETDTNENKNW